MNEPDFIQRYVIRCCPQGDDALEACVEAAKSNWAYLCAIGCGSKQKGEPRRTPDYRGALEPTQRANFDRFLDAYEDRNGMQGAAREWAQINPDPSLAVWIIRAAAAEAEARKHRKTSSPMAQTWLHQRRYQDGVKGPKMAAAHKDWVG